MHNSHHEQFILRTIEVARAAVERGNHPFGALLVDATGTVILEAENTVVTDRDCTGHAETNLVRAASRRFAPDLLRQCSLYSSAEPCAMCAGAIFWAQIPRLIFGVSQALLYEIVGDAAPSLELSCREVLARGGMTVAVTGPVLEAKARTVLDEFWSSHD